LTAAAAPDSAGIAVPGVVDRAAGRLVKAHDKQPRLGGLDLVAWARASFGLPAVIENDARAALVGEITAGSAAGARDAVLMTLGTGIGTAAVMDGTLLRGAHDHAGILGGHLTVDIDAEPCNCGNVGCAESIAGAWAIRRELAARGDAVTDVKAMLAAAEAGDTAAAALRDRAIRAWGATAVSLCHAYDPDVVVLSGGIMRAGAALAAPIEAYVAEHLWTSSYRPSFVIPDRPDLSVLRGLSVLAAENHPRRSTRADR
ncbi:ROK family protein, partial [Glycomyces tenuis]